MKTIILNIVALPTTYIIFSLIFVVADIAFVALYTVLSSTAIAVIPVLVLWSALQCLCIRYILQRLISNGIYYLFSQFLILAYLVWRKVESYFWYSNTYGEELLPAEAQRNVFIAELVVAFMGYVIIVYTWKMFYKK